MNLLFLDSIDKYTFGGYQNWISLIAPALSRRGHRVTIAGRPKSEFIRRFKSSPENVRIFEIAISGDFNPVTILRLKNRLEREQTDVIICDFNKDVRLGGLAARFYGKARVVWRLGLNITRNSFIHRFLTPKLIDAAVVPSHGLKRQVLTFGYLKEADVTVIPHGIPEEANEWSDGQAAVELRKKYKIPGNKTVAVTSGRFVDQKGHRYLIDAAAEIVKEYPDIVFLLLGDGPLENQLRDRIKRLNLTDYFIFAGMLEKFSLELAGADLMVHPSVDEPFGFSVLEGMRAGLPVVASRVGGIPEFAIDGRTAILVKPCNAALLGRAVTEFLRFPEKMNAFGIAGRERWEKDFKLEIMVNRWENYLSDLISKHN